MKNFKELSDNGFYVGKYNFNDENEFLNYAYKYGQVVPAGRGENLVTTISTNDLFGEKEVKLHNDKCYWNIPPRFLIFYIKEINSDCIWNISNISNAFQSLDSDMKSKISNSKFIFNSPQNRDSYSNELYFVNKVNQEYFYRFREDVCNIPSEYLIALKVELIKNIINIKTENGTLIVLNNWHMVHGRTLDDFICNNMKRVAYRALVI